MIGRRFFTAFLEKFRQVLQTLSCQKEQSSPTHSVGNPPDLTKTNQSVINTISAEVEGEEMGNKPLKLPDIDPSAYQDRVFNIIKEQKAPLKETNFSPYTPLPAIGKSRLEEPKRKIVRQKTYRVLEPIYIKGPSDLSKFIPDTDFGMTGFPENMSRRNQNIAHIDSGSLKKVRHIYNNNNNHQVVTKIDNTSNKKLKERNIKPTFFGKSAPERSAKGDSNKLSAVDEDQRSKNVYKENATTFWIDF